MMQKSIYYILLFILGISKPLFSQSNISGIVNNYAAVISYDSCNNNCLNVSSVSGFSVGDFVLVIQMKGMQINETNTASFGRFVAYDSTGYYEKAQIASISGTQICLNSDLEYKYKTSGKVQLVKIARYPLGANVIGNLLAQPWNGTTGGIIAIEVLGTLTLNANIDVSGMGFKGGKSGAAISNLCNALTSVTDYATDSLVWQYKSFKGEGVADYVANKWSSRGPQANGGGGGNDHNSGGGGGANLASGGIGGRNNEPGTFNCKGYQPGLGGLSLIDLLKDRMFFGGGGGSGHQNNAVNFQGGNGGGIIYIKTNTIIGNNKWIMANGDSSKMSGQDGGSGGGAGGTIKLDVNNYSGLLNISANGGRGSSTNNAAGNRCFGPGGGGSGGTILFRTGSIPSGVSAQTLAGAPGVVFNSTNACNGTSNSATAGNVGITTFNNNKLNVSVSGATNCLMRKSTYSFNVEQLLNEAYQLNLSILSNSNKANQIVFEKSNDGENYTTINEIKKESASSDKNIYVDNHPFIGRNYYKASVYEDKTKIYESAVFYVFNGLNWNNDDIMIYPNPVSKEESIKVYFPSSDASLLLKVSDISGKQIISKKLSSEQCKNGYYELDAIDLSYNNMLIIQLISDKGEVFSKKLFIK